MGDVDECPRDPCHPNATCTNTHGGYKCDCNNGFLGDGFNCSDVNECPHDPCHPNATCTNTHGGYKCDCNNGFLGDGLNCSDTNFGAVTEVVLGVLVGILVLL